MPVRLHNVEHFLISAFNFFCNPLSPRRRLTTRIWLVAIVTFTMSTTGFMLGCVCTDKWEITTYDYRFLNETIYNQSAGDQCTYTIAKTFGNGMVLATNEKQKWTSSAGVSASDILNQSINQASACQGPAESRNISLVFPQYGNAFKVCLDVDDDAWINITRLCSPFDIEKCLYYNPQSVKKPFCCKKCLYTEDEVDELDQNGNTTFEPIFTVVGFLIVCLVILCACHILAVIALWRRLVPVVMFTGILFLVSGAFMAFCLAAHQYKITIMNTKRRILPHMTYEMALSSYTESSWSVDAGWMGFAFSIITGILWIRFSFHLASETTYNKIRPTLSTLQNNNAINFNNTAFITGHLSTSQADPSSVANGFAAGGGLLPKSVRWAASSAKNSASTVTPGSRPDSGNQLLRNDQQSEVHAKANGNVHNHDVNHKENPNVPMVVEEAV